MVTRLPAEKSVYIIRHIQVFTSHEAQKWLKLSAEWHQIPNVEMNSITGM